MYPMHTICPRHCAHSATKTVKCQKNHARSMHAKLFTMHGIMHVTMHGQILVPKHAFPCFSNIAESCAWQKVGPFTMHGTMHGIMHGLCTRLCPELCVGTVLMGIGGINKN